MVETRICFLATRRWVATAGLLGALLATIACERRVSTPHTEAAGAIASDTARTMVPNDTTLRFPFLPDSAKTPGAALEVTAGDICVPGYTKKVRNVPIAVKRQVYATYGIRRHQPGEYEVDHLISLELGGSNSIRNLWPESFRTSPWNARVKDALENELHRRVCAGTLDLAAAQQIIARNWVTGYRMYVSSSTPPTQAATRTHGRTRRQRAPRSQPQPESPVP
jgi:hypothetical protein